jgi:hypothetical protein
MCREYFKGMEEGKWASYDFVESSDALWDLSLKTKQMERFLKALRLIKIMAINGRNVEN